MKKFILTTCLMTAVFMSGCSVQNAFTRQTEISFLSIGAITCGGVGALIGGLAGQSIETALIGGASGAALCGGIGYYLDQQEEQLRQKLQNTGVKVIREGESLRLVMPGNILFASSIDRLDSSFFPVLNSIRDVLKEYDETGIVISGHTDSQGSNGSNEELSKRRARSVADYLIFRGVENDRILAVGYGETQPVADNTSAAGRGLNRRVELLIKPRQQH